MINNKKINNRLPYWFIAQAILLFFIHMIFVVSLFALNKERINVNKFLVEIFVMLAVEVVFVFFYVCLENCILGKGWFNYLLQTTFIFKFSYQWCVSLTGLVFILYKKKETTDEFYFVLFSFIWFILSLVSICVCIDKFSNYHNVILIFFFLGYSSSALIAFLPRDVRNDILYFIYDKTNFLTGYAEYSKTREPIDYFFYPLKEAMLAYIIIDSVFINTKSFWDGLRIKLVEKIFNLFNYKDIHVDAIVHDCKIDDKQKVNVDKLATQTIFESEMKLVNIEVESLDSSLERKNYIIRYKKSRQ